MLYRFTSRKISDQGGFTLIELLVVIAIIAILTVVVVLTLNPAQLLAQARDSQRISDVSTLNSAISLYQTDQGSSVSYSMGTPSTIYASIYDSSATSTAGTNCNAVGLPTLPSSYSYHCAASSTYRNNSSIGWVGVNFQNITSGSPLGSLPIDPSNNTSSHLYYTYTTNGSQFEMTAGIESQKYKLGGPNDIITTDGGDLTSAYEKGSLLNLEPDDYSNTSLLFWWPLNEGGASSTVYDHSGNGYNGTWNGTQTGGSYYTTNAKIGTYAGIFDGSTDYVSRSLSGFSPLPVTNATYMAWFNTATTSAQYIIYGWGTNNTGFLDVAPGGYLAFYSDGGGNAVSPSPFTLNTWNFGAVSIDGAGNKSLYWNGLLVATGSPYGGTPNLNLALVIGWNAGGTQGCGPNTCQHFMGEVQDVRIYNQALSATQIQDIYNTLR